MIAQTDAGAAAGADEAIVGPAVAGLPPGEVPAGAPGPPVSGTGTVDSTTAVAEAARAETRIETDDGEVLMRTSPSGRTRIGGDGRIEVREAAAAEDGPVSRSSTLKRSGDSGRRRRWPRSRRRASRRTSGWLG